MTTRILPKEEWPRLAHLDIGPALAIAQDRDATVIVAEDAAGHIVGAWALLLIAHVEGLWVSPQHRKRGRVLLRLWNQLLSVARARGIASVWTGSVTDEVTVLLTARGAVRLPDMYALPLRAARE